VTLLLLLMLLVVALVLLQVARRKLSSAAAGPDTEVSPGKPGEACRKPRPQLQGGLRLGPVINWATLGEGGMQGWILCRRGLQGSKRCPAALLTWLDQILMIVLILVLVLINLEDTELVWCPVQATSPLDRGIPAVLY